jgi:hypothetical protein
MDKQVLYKKESPLPNRINASNFSILYKIVLYKWVGFGGYLLQLEILVITH